MFEIDPLATLTFAQEASNVFLVGPPGGLPAPVPDFVGDILAEIGSIEDAAGGIGETISELTPAGGDTPGKA